MKRLLLILLATLTASPALASQLLEYTINHPSYGNIGTCSNLIEPTTDGSLLTARVSSGPMETVAVSGRPEPLRRFDIQSDKRQYDWVDSQGVPVVLRTEDSGSPVDFILKRREARPDMQEAAVAQDTR